MEIAEFRRRGERFDDEDVAECYAFRPGYPQALYETVLSRIKGRAGLLDLGTGNGKIAGALAARFAAVTAIDPSPPMLRAARRNFDSPNITWICDRVEDALLAGPYDLVTAGASIHWMDPAIVFPKLAETIAEGGAVAIIVGDLQHHPAWEEGWTKLVAQWAERLGDGYHPQKWHATYGTHEPWMDIELKQDFVRAFSQSLEEFILCQHSRASWTRERMGQDLATEFDDDLRSLLAPYTQGGVLHFDVRTSLTLGGPHA